MAINNPYAGFLGVGIYELERFAFVFERKRSAERLGQQRSFTLGQFQDVLHLRVRQSAFGNLDLKSIVKPVRGYQFGDVHPAHEVIILVQFPKFE